MKKQVNEPDFIGGQGPLTKAEEAALSEYFSRRNNKNGKKKQPNAKAKADKAE